MSTFVSFIFTYAQVIIHYRTEHAHQYGICSDDCAQEYEVIHCAGELSNCFAIGSACWFIIKAKDRFTTSIEDGHAVNTYKERFYAVLELDTKPTDGEYITIASRYFSIEDTYVTREAAEHSFHHC
jgi:hypothetical protein